MVRIIQSLIYPNFLIYFFFPKKIRKILAKLVKESEIGNRAEIQIVLEVSIPLMKLLKNETCRKRAEYFFAVNKTWNTENRTGILIYMNLSEKVIEVVSDRGVPTNEIDFQALFKEAKNSNESLSLGVSRWYPSSTHFLVNVLLHLGKFLYKSSLKLKDGEENPNELSDELGF
jgi:hypothetical protein